MRDRFFGVEIEHGNPQGWEYVRSQLAAAFPELHRPGHKNLTLTVGYDGSGVEVRTPPLIGAEGFRTLRSLFSYLRKIGGYTTESDGMHVHFDAPEFLAQPELIVTLAKNWTANENVLLPFVAVRRHRRGSCTRDLTDNALPVPYGVSIKELEAALAAGQPIQEIQRRRGALNLRALQEHGTVEVRLHEGTLEYGQAAAWIRFCIALINASADGKILRTCNTPQELLAEVRPHVSAQRQLSRRATGELVYA